MLPSALVTDAKTQSQILINLQLDMAEMEKHKAFTEWALKQGVKLHGVAANRFPGRGLGIVATEAAPVCPIFFVSSHMIMLQVQQRIFLFSPFPPLAVLLFER